MAKTYTNQKNIDRLREPLFQISRTKFRGVRSSLNENLETNLLKLDLTRISNELDNVDSSILDDLVFLIGDINDINQSVLENDGLSYMISGVKFYFDDTASLSDLEIDTVNKLSSKLSRLTNKVQRLEAGDAL